MLLLSVSCRNGRLQDPISRGFTEEGHPQLELDLILTLATSFQLHEYINSLIHVLDRLSFFRNSCSPQARSLNLNQLPERTFLRILLNIFFLWS